MDERGWIAIWRKLIDSAVFNDSDHFLFKLFMWCLLKAGWKPNTVNGRPLSRGQFVTGRNAAASDLGVSGSKWYRGMQKLVDLEMIQMETVNKRYTVVSVCNYGVYQSVHSRERTTDEQLPDNQRTTDEQPANNQRTQLTREQGKNSKREQGNHSPPLSPPGVRWAEDLPIPSSLDAPEFQGVWDRYLGWWMVSGKRLDAFKGKAQLEMLARSGLEKAVADLRLTMEQSERPGRIWDSSRGVAAKPSGQPTTFAEAKRQRTAEATARAIEQHRKGGNGNGLRKRISP